MIYGVGTDLIEVTRIEKQITGNSRFKQKIFSASEIEYCDSFKVNSAQHYAVRYAAKEAFFKAIGTGYRGGLTFHEVSVESDELGKPRIVLSGKSKDYANANKFTAIHVSLSHLRDYASAVVIIEM